MRVDIYKSPGKYYSKPSGANACNARHLHDVLEVDQIRLEGKKLGSNSRSADTGIGISAKTKKKRTFFFRSLTKGGSSIASKVLGGGPVGTRHHIKRFWPITEGKQISAER